MKRLFSRIESAGILASVLFCVFGAQAQTQTTGTVDGGSPAAAQTASSSSTAQPITQAEINAISDPTVRANAQARFDKARTFTTQADGIERPSDKDSNGRSRVFFSPQKLTSADCLPGRHWELVGGYAGCVCDGDSTHTRVSNDDPAACVVAPPPPPPPPPVTGGGSVAAGFTFGGLGSPTGNALPSTEKVSGTWTMTANYGTSIDLSYTGGLGSVMGIFSGTCNFTLFDYGTGDWGLSGPCGNGSAYGHGGVYINFTGPTYSGTFNGSWNASGASGTLSADINPGVQLFSITQGSTTGFILMDGAGNFTGYSNGNSIYGYMQSKGTGAINVNGSWYAAMTGSGVFGTVIYNGPSYAVGGNSSNFFIVNASGVDIGTGSYMAVPTNDPGWAMYLTNHGLPVPSGFNGLLALPVSSGVFYGCTPLANGVKCAGPAPSRYDVTSP